MKTHNVELEASLMKLASEMWGCDDLSDATGVPPPGVCTWLPEGELKKTAVSEDFGSFQY